MDSVNPFGRSAVRLVSQLSALFILTRLLKVACNSMDTKLPETYIAVGIECTTSAMEKSGGVLTP